MAADVVEHRLGRQADLREQPLRAAAGEVEHRLGFLADLFRSRGSPGRWSGPRCPAARARSSSGSPPGMGLLTKWITWAFNGGLPRVAGGCVSWSCTSPKRRASRWPARCSAIAPVDHRLARQLDGVRVGGVEEDHCGRRAGVEFLLALPAQEVAHGNRHVAEVDVHRARALRTCGTPCSGQRRRRIRRSGAATRRAASAPRTGTPRSAARWRGSCCAGSRAGWRAARGCCTPACTCRSAGSP